MIPSLDIAGRVVSPRDPVFVIAEACDNHLGDMGAAREMVRRAKLAGADAIKFQHHLPDEEMLPDAPMSSNFQEPLYEFLKKHALSLQQHRELKAYCEEVGILYLCTPFSWRAAEELHTIGVSAYKIGSGEMTDIPTLLRIASLGRPMIVSTGMSSWEEIDHTYEALVAKKVPLALLNCVSEYPPVYEDVNLGVIGRMIDRYRGAVIGHSDHTPDLYTSFAAVALGARIIEKHVILDKRQPGPDQSVSIDFAELAQLVEGIRKVEAALGAEKKVHQREDQIRRWAFRSLVTTRPVAAGEVLGEDAVWSKRPGTGIPSHRMLEVIGRRARRDLPANVLLSWDDLEPPSQ
ncbi:MAG: N-acetylneuraminate synthase family protein [Rhodospirillales bacterium]|nr:N-acetylneuraminate synthase family protein [Rhodospirillales bacterium]